MYVVNFNLYILLSQWLGLGLVFKNYNNEIFFIIWEVPYFSHINTFFFFYVPTLFKWKNFHNLLSRSLKSNRLWFAWFLSYRKLWIAVTQLNHWIFSSFRALHNYRHMHICTLIGAEVQIFLLNTFPTFFNDMSCVCALFTNCEIMFTMIKLKIDYEFIYVKISQ